MWSTGLYSCKLSFVCAFILIISKILFFFVFRWGPGTPLSSTTIFTMSLHIYKLITRMHLVVFPFGGVCQFRFSVQYIWYILYFYFVHWFSILLILYFEDKALFFKKGRVTNWRCCVPRIIRSLLGHGLGSNFHSGLILIVKTF